MFQYVHSYLFFFFFFCSCKGYCTHTLNQLKYIHTWGILFPLAVTIIHFMYSFIYFHFYAYH